MAVAGFSTEARHTSYDVIIIGGAMMGSSTAWHLSVAKGFTGRVLVIERDPAYSACSTVHTNSCIRQQFTTEVNIRISQYGAEFIRNFQDLMGDPEAPKLAVQSYGYMYLSASDRLSGVLRDSCKIQNALGSHTRIMSPDQIAAEYPFYNLEDIHLGSHNPVDEGYFDGGTIFDWFRKMARRNGVEYLAGEVVGIDRADGRVSGVRLADGSTIACGALVNASGPRGARTAAMAGLTLPVEPRRRYTFIFDAAEPLGQDLPLTINPSGVHVRSDGRYYLAGGAPADEFDLPADYDDFHMEDGIWEEKFWPAIAHRIPQFERIKLINQWVGHYAFNTLDQNAIIGPAPALPNFYLLNGFSGHGLQQSPAMGRGMSELISEGRFVTLDLTDLSFERILENRPFLEKAVI